MYPCLVLVLILLLYATGYNAQSLTNTWTKIDGGLIHVAIGPAGIWGIGGSDQIYYRVGTYGKPDSTGTTWVQVSGTGRMVDVGRDIVFLCQGDNDCFIRTEISSDNPTGTSWKKVSGNTHQVSVHESRVWFAAENDRVFRQEFGILVQVAGSVSQVSVGPSGVWVVCPPDVVFYRHHTYGEDRGSGDSWTYVGSGFIQVVSGLNGVYALTAGGEIYFRAGVSRWTPTGDQWVQIDGILKQIEEYNGRLVGVTFQGDIYAVKRPNCC